MVHIHEGSKDSAMETAHDKYLCAISDSEKSWCSETDLHNVQCNVEHCSHSQGNITCCLSSRTKPMQCKAQGEDGGTSHSKTTLHPIEIKFDLVLLK
jgi:hypothetical protein